MKALILVGGYGTRLRPLTLSIPKPLVHFANKPMIVHQIEALKSVGVNEVVLAVTEQLKNLMEEVLKEYEEQYKLKITFSVEKEPLGTAGPLALAKDHLIAEGNELFFVLNADVICEYPLKSLLEYHKSHGKEGTIMVTPVDDPSKYGVVVTEHGKEGQIKKFVEKPKIFVGDRINAGIYLFNKNILQRIKAEPTSIEKKIFPEMCIDGQLYSKDLEGFWMDVGQPKDYLVGLTYYLESMARKHPERMAKAPEDASYTISDNTVVISSSAKIGKGCVIGPNVVIGDHVQVGDGVRLVQCVLMDKVKVSNFALVSSSIIGWKSKIGRWSRVQNMSVLAEDVSIADEVFINGAQILPHKSVSDNVMDVGTIIM